MDKIEKKKFDRFYVGCSLVGIGTASMILLLIITALLLSSCRSVKYVPVPEYHTDTLIINKHQLDSIWMHDSIYHHEKGDTVLIEKWHTKYVLKEVHDTLYQAKVDSIPYPVPVPEYIEKQLTWWQQTRLHLANVLLIALLILGCGWFVKRKFF